VGADAPDSDPSFDSVAFALFLLVPFQFLTYVHITFWTSRLVYSMVPTMLRRE